MFVYSHIPVFNRLTDKEEFFFFSFAPRLGANNEMET